MNNHKQKDKILSLEDFYNGTLLSIETAESLHDEAILLSNNNKHAGSLTKCVLSLEEIGKSILLVLQAILIIQLKDIDRRYWRRFWSIFYSHTKKLNFAIQYYLFSSDINVNNKEDIHHIFKFIQNTSKELDKDKQKGQYTDFSENKFVRPIEIDFKENSESLHVVLDRLIDLQRETFPNELSFDNYIKIITDKLKYTQSIKMLEKETDSPIPTENFINHDYFELALDKWLEAYLIKMGVILPEYTIINNSDIRRIAEGTFGVFKIDIEHKNIFHFKGIFD